MNDNILKILLRDQTTGKNIMWATSELTTQEIFLEDVEKIEPRWKKNRSEQKSRTKSRAEIFTPPDVCKIQNDTLFDSLFNNKNDWQDIIDAKFLEITCGEAPYIVSRYNAVTGELIDIEQRDGILNRKLKIIAKETNTSADRIDFAIRALKSVYGYEFQGDNLFLARKNIFETVEEFLSNTMSAVELNEKLHQVAEIISWNFWQMDGLQYTIPFANADRQSKFDFDNKTTQTPSGEIFCKIMDWKANKAFEFCKLYGGGKK